MSKIINMKGNIYSILNIKKAIQNIQGRFINLEVNRGRKKYESLNGYIKDTYDNIFTFIEDDKLYSFSYVDILTKDIKIFPYQ